MFVIFKLLGSKPTLKSANKSSVMKCVREETLIKRVHGKLYASRSERDMVTEKSMNKGCCCSYVVLN